MAIAKVVAHLTLHEAQHKMATHVASGRLPHFLILSLQWWPIEQVLINAFTSQHLAQDLLSHGDTADTALLHVLQPLSHLQIPSSDCHSIT